VAAQEPTAGVDEGAAGAPEGSLAQRRLLEAAVGYVVEHGLGGLRLRELAAAIGTSHRMLIYHFGSKEGLVVAIVRAVEAEQRAVLSGLAARPGMATAELARLMWRRVTDPQLRSRERLFFEAYGQALQGRPGTAGLLDGIVEDWVEPMAAEAIAGGAAPGEARADARLAVAVCRGLLLDLLATGDERAVDQAFERYLTRLGVASAG